MESLLSGTIRRRIVESVVLKNFIFSFVSICFHYTLTCFLSVTITVAMYQVHSMFTNFPIFTYSRLNRLLNRG